MVIAIFSDLEKRRRDCEEHPAMRSPMTQMPRSARPDILGTNLAATLAGFEQARCCMGLASISPLGTALLVSKPVENRLAHQKNSNRRGKNRLD
jgi:hypothetical protein